MLVAFGLLTNITTGGVPGGGKAIHKSRCRQHQPTSKENETHNHPSHTQRSQSQNDPKRTFDFARLRRSNPRRRRLQLCLWCWSSLHVLRRSALLIFYQILPKTSRSCFVLEGQVICFAGLVFLVGSYGLLVCFVSLVTTAKACLC